MEPKLCGVKAVGSDQIMFLGMATEEKGNLVHVNIGYGITSDDYVALSDIFGNTSKVKVQRFIMQSLWFHRDSIVLQ